MTERESRRDGIGDGGGGGGVPMGRGCCKDVLMAESEVESRGSSFGRQKGWYLCGERGRVKQRLGR